MRIDSATIGTSRKEELIAGELHDTYVRYVEAAASVNGQCPLASRHLERLTR